MLKKLLCAGITGLVLSLPSVMAQESSKDEVPKQEQKEEKKDLELITLEEVEKLMQRGSVDAILKEELDNDLIIPVRYDLKTLKTNYEEIVYQENKKVDERKPSLVFFYNSGFPKAFNPEVGKRLAIIFKKLFDKYTGKLNYFVYDFNINPDFKPKNDEEYETCVSKFGITDTPSLSLYSVFDVVKGETPNNNDGRVKQIDVLKGGPTADKYVLKWFYPTNFDKDASVIDWIEGNLWMSDKNWCWRFEGTNIEKKVQVISYTKK